MAAGLGQDIAKLLPHADAAVRQRELKRNCQSAITRRLLVNSGLEGEKVHSRMLILAGEAVEEICKMQAYVWFLKTFYNNNKPSMFTPEQTHLDLRRAVLDNVFNSKKQTNWRESFDELHTMLHGLVYKDWA